MSMYVEFELRIRGSKAACMDYAENYLPNYKGYVSDYLTTFWKGGTEDDYRMAFSCALRSYIPKYMDLQYASEKLSLEMEIFGSDYGEPDVWEHYHYKNGEVLVDESFSGWISPERYGRLETDELRSMYRREDDWYVLKDEFVKLRWIDEDSFECDFSAGMEKPEVTEGDEAAEEPEDPDKPREYAEYIPEFDHVEAVIHGYPDDFVLQYCEKNRDEVSSFCEWLGYTDEKRLDEFCFRLIPPVDVDAVLTDAALAKKYLSTMYMERLLHAYLMPIMGIEEIGDYRGSCCGGDLEEFKKFAVEDIKDFFTRVPVWC